MAKRIHISRYYADDKDIEDLISQNLIKPPQLGAFLRERGIIVSNRMSKEEMVRYFRFLRLAWSDFDSLLARLDRPDREEDFTGCRLKARGLNLDIIMERLETIRQNRADRLGEIHKAERISPNIIELRVQYSEIDPSKTRALQRREKWLTIRIEQSLDIFKVRHHDNGRAKAIVEQLEDDLNKLTHPAPRETVDVSDLSTAKRDDFFIQMARSVQGYDLDDVSDLKVERPEPAEGEDNNDQARAKPTRAESKFKGIVKKAALSGTDLLLTEDYQRYSSKGYTMSKMVWTLRETAKESDVLELMAEFRGKGGTEFRYDAVGAYRRQDDGSISDARIALTPDDKQRLLDLLEASAFATLAVIRGSNQADGAPAPHHGTAVETEAEATA